MGLLRNYILIFIFGWGLWFWLDKSGVPDTSVPGRSPYAGMQAPAFPRYRSYPGQGALQSPPREDDLLRDLQYGVDLLKAGGYQQSFTFLWRRQSWLLAGVLTLLLSLLLSGLRRSTVRWRRSRPGPQ